MAPRPAVKGHQIIRADRRVPGLGPVPAVDPDPDR